MFSSIWSADSGDIVAAVFTHGSIHPPGYPLYYLLGRLFVFIPWFEPVQKIALISLIFSILTVIFTIKLLRLMGGINPSKALKKAASWYQFVSLALVFSGQLWLIYSFVPEVFTMTTFFLVASLYYLSRFYLKGSESDHIKYWIFFAWGVTHQYLLLLNIFIYLFVLWQMHYQWRHFLRRNFTKLVLVVLSAILPYILFYLCWDKSAIIRWEPKTLVGLFDLMTRRSYGFFATTTGSYQDLWGKIGNFIFYLQTLATNYSVVIYAILLFGLWRMVRQKNKLNWLLLLALFLYGPAFIFYLDTHLSQAMGRGILERFVLISFPLLTVVVFHGLVEGLVLLQAITQKWFTTTSGKQLLTGAYFLLVCLLLFSLVFRNGFFVIGLREKKLFDLHAQNLLESLPKNSIVIMNGDMDLFPSQYWRYAKKNRTDIALLSGTKIAKANYLEIVKHNFPNLNTQTKLAGSTIEFIKLNFRHYPVFTNFNFDTEFFGFEKQGLLYRVVNKKTPKKPYFPVKLSNRIWDEMGSYSQKIPFYAALKVKYGKALYEVANTYFRRKDFLLANAYFYEAYRFMPEDNTLVEDYALSLLKTNNCALAEKILTQSYANDHHRQAAFYLSRLSAVCYHDRSKYLYWDSLYRKE